MTLLAPWFLWAALAAAGVVVALHFLARRRPKAVPLPTARFVPERAIRAPAPYRRPSDLVVLALRVAALVLLGLALARPQREAARQPVGELRIDSAATFSQAFAAALQSSASRRDAVDSIALLIEMPLTRDRWDAGTIPWRNQWPGSVELRHAEARGTQEARTDWREGPGGDALRAIVLGDIVAVGHFQPLPLPPGTPIAFFEDGTPAAVEHDCVRTVGIGMPADDSHLRPAFQRLAARIRSAPCGAIHADTTPLDSAQLAFLRGTGGAAPVSALPSARPPVRPSALLLVLAAVALIGEQIVRRRAS